MNITEFVSQIRDTAKEHYKNNPNKSSEWDNFYKLELDANVRSETKQPIENVIWSKRDAAIGTYKVFVHHYRAHRKRGCGSAKYQVYIRANGTIKVQKGTLDGGDPIKEVGQFTISNDKMSEVESLDYQIFEEILKETKDSLVEFGYELSTKDAILFTIQKHISPF